MKPVLRNCDDRLALNVEIAARLREARSCAKPTPAYLAERTAGEISASMISRFEGAQRRLSIEEARPLAMALGTVRPSDRPRSSPGQAR